MNRDLDFVDQQQEHWEHEAGVADELTNAYRYSRQITFIPNDTPTITRERKAGKFVAVRDRIIYCRFTDAILGNAKEFVGSSPVKTEALALLHESCEDVEYYVLEPIR